METTQISNNSRMDKYSRTRILRDNEMSKLIAIHHIMDESHKQDIEG